MKRLPWVLQTPARETRYENPETSGTFAPQPLLLEAPGSYFPSYNTSTLDHEATTPLLLSRLLFYILMIYFTPNWPLVLSVGYLTFTPIRIRLLPYTQDTYFYLGRRYYVKRSRTKNYARIEERWLDKFFKLKLRFFVPYQKFRKIFLVIYW